eukprot:Nitzschia sp. Nitz4//scaffold189_size62959//8031//9080//NITZ4_006301-RA/size62959-processed-gene-0.16-mRNA-1//1//CDS//3329539875//3213//frame0
MTHGNNSSFGNQRHNQTLQMPRRIRRVVLVLISCVISVLSVSQFQWSLALEEPHVVPDPHIAVPPPAHLEPPSSPTTCESFGKNVKKVRFYPKRFFEEGSGASFLRSLLWHRDNQTDNILNVRFLVFEEPDCSIVHYHIHKNGGTTMERQVPIKMDKFYSKREKEMGREAFEAASLDIVANRIVPWQRNKTGSSPFHTFAFWRDPVPRFLSQVTQVLKLREWHTRLDPCYKHNSTGDMLDCVLDMLEKGRFPEMHLSPQSYELYKYAMNTNLYIDLMDLHEMDAVLKQLGVTAPIRKDRATHGLVRRFPQFRISMDALNEERIRRICHIYAADVVVIQETNIVQTMCLS